MRISKFIFFFQAEDGIRDVAVTGVQTCALPILARLTALEITKLEDELKEVRKFIKECKEILASKPRRMKILKEELTELAAGFGDQRRTEIVADQGEFSIEDLIAEEDMGITVSHAGYIKR